MFDELTWDAILQAWPWFAAAATAFVVAAGLFVALKPKPQPQPEKATDAADNMEWTLTGRIDFANSHLGDFVLEVEETRTALPLLAALSIETSVGPERRLRMRRWSSSPITPQKIFRCRWTFQLMPRLQPNEVATVRLLTGPKI
jgi:hypothetical protein